MGSSLCTQQAENSAWPAVGVSVQGTGTWEGISGVPGLMRSAAEPELTLPWAVVTDWGQQKICCL